MFSINFLVDFLGLVVSFFGIWFVVCMSKINYQTEFKDLLICAGESIGLASVACLPFTIEVITGLMSAWVQITVAITIFGLFFQSVRIAGLVFDELVRIPKMEKFHRN